MFIRVVALAALVLFAASLLLASEESDRLAAIEKRLQQLEKENKQLKDQINARETNIQGQVDGVYYRAMGAATPTRGIAYLGSAQPDVKGTGLIFTGDFIYWKPQQSLTDFATINDPGVGEDTDQQTGRHRHLEHDWAPGFRLGLGYRLPHDAWDIRATYTYLRSDASTTILDPADLLVEHLTNADDSDDQADVAKASLDLDYDVLDIEIGRPFEFSKSINIRPFGGVRLAWIENDAKFNYYGDDHRAFNTPQSAGDEIRNRSDFFGYGIRLGAEGDVKIAHGFGFYGKAEASLLTGEFDLRYQEGTDDGDNGSTADNGVIEAGELDYSVRQELHRVVPVVEFAAGVSWDKKLMDNLNIKATVGYEFVNYFNMVNRRQFVDDVKDSTMVTEGAEDLGFHGLFFRIKVDF